MMSFGKGHSTGNLPDGVKSGAAAGGLVRPKDKNA